MGEGDMSFDPSFGGGGGGDEDDWGGATHPNFGAMPAFGPGGTFYLPRDLPRGLPPPGQGSLRYGMGGSGGGGTPGTPGSAHTGSPYTALVAEYSPATPRTMYSSPTRQSRTSLYYSPQAGGQASSSLVMSAMTYDALPPDMDESSFYGEPQGVPVIGLPSLAYASTFHGLAPAGTWRKQRGVSFRYYVHEALTCNGFGNVRLIESAHDADFVYTSCVAHDIFASSPDTPVTQLVLANSLGILHARNAVGSEVFYYQTRAAPSVQRDELLLLRRNAEEGLAGLSIHTF